MQVSDIKRVIDQISRDKGIDRHVLIATLEEALKSAARKKHGNRIDVEVQYNEETGEIEVFQFKEVAETVEDPELQMSVEEGRQLDPDCEIGDSLGTKMETSSFGRIAAQSAKQVIIQKMKDAERDAVYKSFIDRKGEIVNGILQRNNKGDLIVNLGQTEGMLPVSEQVPRETFQRGDRVRAYILDVMQDTRGPQIILSRTHPGFLVQLFKTEVPEISEGIVEVMGAVREAGSRAKIAVTSSDSDIDPVGACVGMKGSRVQNVVQELKGEKIDIIPWHADAAKYVCNALAPAQISRVIIDDENRSMEVIVPDEFLSIAIGKRGQNVRLASKLTSWHLDVKSESKYSKTMKDGYDSLMSLSSVTISMADSLYEKGLYSIEEISNASVKDLVQIRDMTEDKAIQLIKEAREALGVVINNEDIFKRNRNFQNDAATNDNEQLLNNQDDEKYETKDSEDDVHTIEKDDNNIIYDPDDEKDDNEVSDVDDEEDMNDDGIEDDEYDLDDDDDDIDDEDDDDDIDDDDDDDDDIDDEDDDDDDIDDEDDDDDDDDIDEDEDEDDEDEDDEDDEDDDEDDTEEEENDDEDDEK
jgi:N utilization substance protein A